MSKLKKWEKHWKKVGNYSTGVLLIEMGKIIKRCPDTVYCMLDFIDATNEFNSGKMTTDEYNEFIVNEIKHLKNKLC